MDNNDNTAEQVSQEKRLKQAELEEINLELEALGLPRVQDLPNPKIKYERAIPLLVKWLNQATSHSVKSMVIDALGTPEAHSAQQALIDAFRQADAGQRFEHHKWTIGNALWYFADDSKADDLIEIATDTRHGRDRNMVVSALGRLKDPRVTDVLIHLLNDPDVRLSAISSLAKLAPMAAKPYLEALSNDKEPHIRRAAAKALAKIEKKHSPAPKPPSAASMINRVAAGDPLPKGYEEYSISCDYEDLEAMLEALAKTAGSGFGKMQLAQVLTDAELLDEDGTLAYDFPVKYQGEQTTMRLIIRNKTDEPDLYVYSIPALVADFDVKMSALMEKLDK